jgi:hypothetical protein
VIAHYLGKGHTLEELVNLTSSERLFYMAAWEAELEYMEKAMGEVK